MVSLQMVPPVLGVLGLLVAFLLYAAIRRYPAGEGRIAEIALAIQLGAMVFLKREYGILGIFVLVVTVLILVSPLGMNTAFAFVLGAVASAAAGYIGMYAATRANVRTTMAAHTVGAPTALTIAFFGGSVMGLTVASIGLMGLGILYLLFGGDPESSFAIHGFGMGASSVALFSRVGGGIFTKSADVGADLVGKIEAGIPEDDPRNPGVIADNVGDNVGDVAGMGSDIFESYCGAMIATIAMASTMALERLAQLGERQDLMFLPLALASAGLICSIMGILLVRQFSAKSPEVALRIGTIGASILFILVAYFVVSGVGVAATVWGAVLAGSVGGIIIGLVTEYFTGGKPVRLIAKAGETGPATVMITGLATGMYSVDRPGADDLRHHLRLDPAVRPVRRRYRGGRDARHRRHHHGDRRLRAGGGQCRRHRRDGRAGRRHAQDHGLAGRAGQYHCRDRQGIRDRGGGAGRPRHHHGLCAGCRPCMCPASTLIWAILRC
jgi:K(+)-stimulated pyrophosphate-energized sodium pump